MAALCILCAPLILLALLNQPERAASTQLASTQCAREMLFVSLLSSLSTAVPAGLYVILQGCTSGGSFVGQHWFYQCYLQLPLLLV
jgi:hypothetical protein